MNTKQFIVKVLSPYKIYCVVLCLIIILSAISANIEKYFMKFIINASVNSTFNIYLICIFFVIWRFSDYTIWRVYDYCILQVSPKIKTNAVAIFFKKLSGQSYQFFHEHLPGNISATINSVFDSTYYALISFLHDILYPCAMLISALIILWPVNKLFAISLMFWTAIILLLIYFATKQINKLGRESTAAHYELNGELIDFLMNINSVILFARRKHEINIFQNSIDNFITKERKRIKYMNVFYAILHCTSITYQCMLLYLMISLYMQNLITVGDFALIISINFHFFDILALSIIQWRYLLGYLSTIQKALTLYNVNNKIIEAKDAKNLEVKKGAIKFKDVSFGYSPENLLFKNITITIPPQQKVGLVGYSGGGKTTFVNLLLRLYESTSGDILIDNIPIKDVTEKSLHKNIGVIPQNPILFSRSIKDNILYGKPEAKDDEVIAASQAANAHEFIMTFPDQYETMIGGDHGIKLSGGQQQRIAIARVILKNAPILILDEATSQLDSVTEQEIQNTIYDFMKDKTTLIVAHRLSTLSQVERIIVFEHGSIVEDGTHEELIKNKKGLYAKLYSMQSE